jgi:hypothetical protein
MSDPTTEPYLEVRVLFPGDTTFAAVLAAAGLCPIDAVGTVEVWLSIADPSVDGQEGAR